jgi:hypothetical protein
MADAGEDDTVGDLRKEMVLEEGFVYFFRRGREASWHEANGFKANEFRDRDEFLETCKATGWKMQLLYKDGFVHESVPVYP